MQYLLNIVNHDTRSSLKDDHLNAIYSLNTETELLKLKLELEMILLVQKL